MKKAPKISIVTPSYNQGRFIEETIKSIISQEGDFYLEYIIMDGGSDDNSVEVIKKYDSLLKENKWPVKCLGITYSWVSGKDDGQADAINKGFARCTGDILNWINSDDRLTPGALASVVLSVRKAPRAGAWVASCNLIDEKGKALLTVIPRGLTKDEMADWGVAGHFFQPSCFFSKKAWELCGPLDESLYTTFDFNLFLTIAAEFEFKGCEGVWSEAIIHKDAKTQARRALLRAEKYVVQIRHGYERLAIKYIEKAEAVAIKHEGKYSTRVSRYYEGGVRALATAGKKILK